jgi:hypothetical protein
MQDFLDQVAIALCILECLVVGLGVEALQVCKVYISSFCLPPLWVTLESDNVLQGLTRLSTSVRASYAVTKVFGAPYCITAYWTQLNLKNQNQQYTLFLKETPNCLQLISYMFQPISAIIN